MKQLASCRRIELIGRLRNRRGNGCDERENGYGTETAIVGDRRAAERRKSTLFNRLTGTRRAIVTDEPGITRDRMYGECEWRGRVMEMVDTGGIIPDDKALIPTEIFRQARVAIDDNALLVLVVDSTAGITPLDQELARLLRTTGGRFSWR